MSKTPSAILSDALASFNRTATLAITTAQERAREDVTQAIADSREARRERDEAVKSLHASRLEEQAWKQDAGVWKAAADQAELTINHHLETIAQLRQEATQWKDQCLRLEETSRQEAISWKEQFLRVEQERSKLAQRVEELVAEQISGGHGQPPPTPFTPAPRYSAIVGLSASALSQGTSARPPPKSTPSASKPTSNTRKRPAPNMQLPTPISENQRNARQRATQAIPPALQSGPSSNSTQQTLVRRVHAVVEVPLKEESVERELATLAPNDSVSASAIAPTPAPISKTVKTVAQAAPPGCISPRPKRKAMAKRSYVEIDTSESDDASDDSAESDAEQTRAISDGDDELRMGVETNRKEVYGKAPRKLLLKPATSALAPMIRKRKTQPPPTSKKSRPSTTTTIP